MATRVHTSRKLKVYFPTGKLDLQQKRRTSTTAQSASTGGTAGHIGLSGTNEVQKLTITGTPTGGTFTITFSGQTTAAIAFNASAFTIQLAMEALSNIATGDLEVYSATLGGTLPTYSMFFRFKGLYEGIDVPVMTTTDSLTGGSLPASAVTVIQAGSAPGTNSRSYAGGFDHQQSYINYEAEAPKATAIPTGEASYVRTGSITHVVESTTGSDASKKLWRGNTFSKRISW